MPRQDSVLELGLGIPRDSTIKMVSNLQESEGTHRRSSLEEIEIFPWANCQEIDALGDPTWLDLGKRGKW